MQNIIKKVVWGCLLIIPFIALHVGDMGLIDVFKWFGSSGMFFPFISGKNLLFRILVEVAFAGWAVLALHDSSYRVKVFKSPIMIAYGLFMIVLFFADMFGVDREKSMWSNFERMEGFVGHIHLFAYFFVLTVMVRSLDEWRKVWKVFLAADILMLIVGAFQLIGARGLYFSKHAPALSDWFNERFPIHQSAIRVDGTIGNSAYFGVFCLIYIFITAMLWSQERQFKKHYGYLALIIANVIGVLYSGTRGTMVGLVVATFVTLGILAFKEKGVLRKRFIIGTVIFAVLIGSLFVFKNTTFVQSYPVLARIASISPNDITGMSRLSMWKISYEAWLERPILGYGQDNFSHIFARKFISDKMCNLEPWYDRSHDVFFDWLVAAGALGLLTYLSLYGVTLWFMWKKKGHDMSLEEKSILTGLIAGYFVHNIFVFDNLTSYILFFAILAYITVRTREAFPDKKQPLFDNDQMNLLIVPLIAIALVVTQYFVNVRPLIVNNLIIKAMTLSQYMKTMPFPDALKMSQTAFTDAIAMNTLGSIEAREQFMQMSVHVGQIKLPESLAVGEKQIAAQAINNYLLAAKDEVEKSLPRYQEDVRMLSIYGLFFLGFGDGATGEKILGDAHRLAPGKQLISYDLIRAMLLQRKTAEAYTLAKETYELSDVCHDADRWLLIGAAYAGKYKEGEAMILAKGKVPPLDVDIVAGVLASNQTGVAIELLNKLKAKDPSLAPQIDQYIKQLLAGKK